MKAKCTSDKLTYTTYGKIYGVIDKQSVSILIQDDSGCRRWYDTNDFQILEDNPAEIPKQVVNDKVVCCRDDDSLTCGDVYRIVDESSDMIQVVDDFGLHNWFDKSMFVTYSTPQESKQLPLVMKFKVDSLLDSLLIQKALFEAGYSWAESGDKVREKYYPYIYTNHDKHIWVSDDANSYKSHLGVPSTVESTLKIVEFVDNVQVEGYSVDRELLMEFLKKNGNEISH